MRRLACALATALWLSTPVSGQVSQSETPAILVADQVYVTPDRKLVAEGQV